MPGVIQGGSSYPRVADVMNLARARVNDTAMGLDGDLLNNDQPHTLVFLNSAWRWLQLKASNAGVETPIRETVISQFPGSTDMTQQSSITWTGAMVQGFAYPQPSLPLDMISPLDVWVDQGNGMYRMGQADSGLPVWYDTSAYDWRTDGMYFWPLVQPVDIRIRYQASREDLRLDDPNYLIPFMLCHDALSARVAWEFANARGATQAPALATMADQAFNEIAVRTGRKNQRRNLRRQPFSGYEGYTNPWPLRY